MSVKDLSHIEPSASSTAVDVWRACVGRHMLPGLEIMPSTRDRIFADLMAFDFAGARLWSLRSNAQRAVRRQTVSNRRFLPVAIFQLKGAARLVQGGRQCELKPDTFAFVNAAEPLELDHLGDFEQLYLQFPDRSFAPAEFHRAVSICMDAEQAVDRPLFECARNLWAAAPSLAPLEHRAALSALLSLSTITSAFHSARDQLHEQTPVRVERAMAYIEHNLGDENLNAQAVADAQSVSRRYLDELFAKSGHRIETWIWERRLQRAAEELMTPDRSDRSLLQIALDVGFKSPSHFSRSFAKRFGVAPRAYRRLHDHSVATGENDAHASALDP